MAKSAVCTQWSHWDLINTTCLVFRIGACHLFRIFRMGVRPLFAPFRRRRGLDRRRKFIIKCRTYMYVW